MYKDFPKAQIVERRDLTPRLMIIKILPEIEFSFLPGQYCTIVLDKLPKAPRPYSIASSPREKFLELFIELVPQGVFTPRLWQIKVNDTIRIFPQAKGKFLFRPEYPIQVMIATVTGIVPYMSMIRDYVRRGQQDHRFFVFQGASYQDEFGYLEELTELMRTFPNLVYVPAVSRPDEPKNLTWQGRKGRVNLIVEELLAEFNIEPQNTLVYLCGNPGMIDDLETKLTSRGYLITAETYYK